MSDTSKVSVLEAGRIRLEVWMPLASEQADIAIRDGLPHDGFGAGLPNTIAECDLEAVLSYEVSPGRWICDVLFRNGIRVGTPDFQILPTRIEAEKAGLLILISLLVEFRLQGA